MKRPAKVVNVADRAAKETSFAKEVLAPLAGMGLTMARMVENLTGKVSPTISYPEERRSYSDRYRGAHILTAREDGTPRCVACYMCATACPADCIYIEAKEVDNPLIEKAPARFEIDMLRCVFCGFCVDACPEEAIIMSREMEICAYTREETLWGIDRLMKRPELPEFGLGYRPHEKLIDSTLAFVPKERVRKKLAGRVTLKEDATMIPHLTFDPDEKRNED
ncbi:MAG TPA: NADH-quinone oxidoreductase subunit I [Blastocatellia bacterium]|nr:NADH-quinone oxidoreductase subunit I [Blastocatellia bacterium]